MEKIWEALTDPVWWLTAFVAAIIAGLLTTRTDRVLGSLSASYQKRRRSNARRRLRNACAAAQDPAGLLMYLGFINLYAIGAVVFLILALSNPTRNEVIKFSALADVKPYLGMFIEATRIVALVIAMYLGYRIGKRIEFFYLAYFFYRRRRMRKRFPWAWRRAYGRRRARRLAQH